MKTIAPLWARIIVGLMGFVFLASSLIGGGFAPPGMSTDTSAPLCLQLTQRGAWRGNVDCHRLRGARSDRRRNGRPLHP